MAGGSISSQPGSPRVTADPGASHRPSEITLLQERAAGTFARVYQAQARGADGLARIVAVKILKEQWSESSDLVNRTRDEARLLARLHHKNILRVEAMAELQGQPAIIMEFVDGLDLKQLIERLAPRGRRIPPRAAYKIAQDSAGALEAAYATVPWGMTDPLQVVHRDVKPSNIMVSVQGEVKVLDFGTARYNWEDRLARTGALRFGSLKYMSPERRMGDRGDHDSDIYALGLVLIEMLQGELLPILPMDPGEHDRAIHSAVGALGDLGLPNEQWAGSLRETLTRICSSRPEQRLTASQLVQLLRAFSDQASGPSLDAFAAEVIAEESRALYGAAADGALSGSRLLISSTTGGEEGGGEALAPQTPLPLDPSASLVHPLPGRSATREALDGVAPPASAPVHQLRAPPAAQAPQAAVVRQPAVDPVPPPQEQWEEEEPQAAPGGSKLLVFVAIGAVVGLIALVALVVVAVAIFLLTAQRSIPDPVTVDVPTPAVPVAAPPNAVPFSVTAEGEGLQWIRLIDAQGGRVVDGSPEGKASIAPGPYRLEAKLVGRSKVSAPVKVEGPLQLTCGPDGKKVLHCRSADGAVALDLK